MPTGIIASPTEWLTEAGIDYTAELVKENNYIGVSGFLPQVEIDERLFEYEKFDESTYHRYRAKAGQNDPTLTMNKSATVVADNLTHDYRFGATYGPHNISKRKPENSVQHSKMQESSRIVHLDYEIDINSVMATASQTAAVTAAWGNASSDPVADFEAAAAAMLFGLKVTHVGISLDAIRRLRNDANFIQYVNGTISRGSMSDADVAESLGSIMGSGKAVNLKVFNAAYNSADPDTSDTFTEATAMTSTVVHCFHSDSSGDDNAPSAYKEFYMPSEEGVYVSEDHDKARNVTTVAKKLVRKTVLTADKLAYRITGA